MDSASSSGDESERESPLEQRQDPRDDISSATLSPTGQDAQDDSSRKASKSSAHKRRRVTRACDECRRKKIKCDGKQPCTHCTVYSYECTYDQPSYRRKNPAPHYIAALEQRLTRTEAILRAYLPHLDLNDPSLDAMLEQQGSLGATSQPKFDPSTQDEPIFKTSSNESKLESMVWATGRLELDNEGHWDYFGNSSGINFICGMRENFGDFDSSEQSEQERNPRARSQKPDIRVPSPHNLVGFTMGSPYEPNYVGTDELPPKARALRLCARALIDASAILEIVHQPSFYKSLDRIYDISIEQYTNDDQKFLPLLYTVLALGCLFAGDEESDLEQQGYKTATGIGYKYFWAARQLLDITDCRDLISIQAIIFMIMFLQCSAKLATCYSYIGVALRCALRMGLHRSFRDSFSPIEAECRKRAFWVIRKMDVFVGAMLGLPQTLHDDDIDQEYPLEVDNEYITDEGISSMPQGKVSKLTASNANFRLCKIMSKIVRYVYPIKGFQIQEHQTPGSYSVSYTLIREIEMDLQRWHESLPTDLLPGETGPPHKIRQQQLLRMAYAHTQMMLYRPFLHYVSSKAKSKPINQRCYACAAACVSVSHNITHLTSEMSRKGLLEGSYWFTMYTTFFAVLSLIFFALENPDSSSSQDAFRDAKEGKETLLKLAKRSMAADRCATTLKNLFEQVQPTLEKGLLSAKAKANAQHSNSSSTPSSERWRTFSDYIPEEVKNRNKASSATQAPYNTSRGAGGARQRGMRLISQTGRPAPGKQQHQQRSQPHNTSQPIYPSSRNPYQQHVQNQSTELSASSSSGTSCVPKAESPGPCTSSSMFELSNLPHNQEFFDPAPQYPLLPAQYHENTQPSNISNFASMMFPSDNPFQYPHPPMTTLEQNYAFQPQGPYPSSQASQSSPQDVYLPASTSGADNVSVDDHIDVQLFGPLPPYLNQADGNSSQHSGSHGPGMDSFGLGGSTGVSFAQPATSQGPPPSGPEMWNQQAHSHGLAGMDWGDFFGAEGWSAPNQ